MIKFYTDIIFNIGSIDALVTLVPVLVTIAFFTLAERKVMAAVQRRKGPNRVGFGGVLQPFADGLKLILKEAIIPINANKYLFIAAPFLTLFLSFLGWAVIPFSYRSTLLTMNASVMYLLAVSSVGIYGVLLAGWASNSKYALLGATRAVAQMISYEIVLSVAILPVIVLAGSLNVLNIVFVQSKTIWFIFPLLTSAIIFFIAILAETNRVPFDLPEAEAELVAGYNVEYGGIIFAAFFLGEYGNMLLMSAIFVLFFLGGWTPYIILPELVMSAKVILVAFMFIFVRANLPRYRFDQLMALCWKVFLPVTLGFFVLVCGLVLAFDVAELKQIPLYRLTR